MSAVVRRLRPPGLRNYKKYKYYLRIDFQCRCAYCGVHEANFGTYWNFTVDHFRPRSKFPSLDCHYPNLYYACNPCNAFKRDQWPSARQRGSGSRFFDPCVDDFGDHFAQLSDGSLSGRTEAGAYTISSIRLNRDPLRCRRFRMSQLAAQIDGLRAELLELEADPILPELGLKRQRFIERMQLNIELLQDDLTPPCDAFTGPQNAARWSSGNSATR
jgi:hypothetical protein